MNEQISFSYRKCQNCGLIAPYTQEVLGKAYCIDCYEKFDRGYLKRVREVEEESHKKNDFLCGDCAKKAKLSLADRMAMAQRIKDGSICCKCKTKYIYKNDKYQKIKGFR